MLHINFFREDSGLFCDKGIKVCQCPKPAVLSFPAVAFRHCTSNGTWAPRANYDQCIMVSLIIISQPFKPSSAKFGSLHALGVLFIIRMI